MQIVSIDLLNLDHCSSNFEYLLVVTDPFTRYTQAYPTRNKALRTAAERIFSDFILRSGIPKYILHDQGKGSDSKFFHQLIKLYGVKQLRTTPYYPKTNGAVERMNSTVPLDIPRIIYYKYKWG